MIKSIIDDWPVEYNEELFENLFKKVLEIKNCQPCEVGLLLTNDKNIKKLNKKFRNIDKSTNVLSFPQYNSDDKVLKIGNIYLGDIAMSYQTIVKEAQQYQIDFTNRCAHLFVHGILHLFGMDHIEDNERLAMESLEIEILSSFNINNPYVY